MTLIEILSSVIVTIVPLGGTMGDNTICDGEVQGIYDGSIYICEGDYMEFSKYHEYGHFLIDSGYFSNKDIETYKKIFNNDLKKGIRAFHSEYEMTDWEESFCTDFSLMMIGEKTNIFIKKRQKLILQILNSH